MTHKAVEWRFFDAETAAEWDEQIPAKQPTAPASADNAHEISQATRKTRYLYELICVIALLYGLTVYLLWQQAAQRIALLDRDVATLRDEFASLEQSNIEAPAATKDENNNIRSTETTYLRFEASPEMMKIVQQIAPRVDDKYQQLHRIFGLTLPSSTKKLKIIIDPTIYMPADSATGDFNNPVTHEGQLVAIHPKFAAKRYGISEAEALTIEIFVRLAINLSENAVANRQIKTQWQGMTLALETYFQLEYGYNQNWQWEDMFLLQRYNAQSHSLDLVHGIIYEPEGQSTDQLQVRPIAFATANSLVEFIMVTYGDGKVPALLDAFGVYNSWETLTPALFHLSADEFEEQWHAYLRTHYPIKCTLDCTFCARAICYALVLK